MSLLSSYLFVYLRVYLCIYLFKRLFTYLFIYLFISVTQILHLRNVRKYMNDEKESIWQEVTLA
jgi:hypothetical protein